MARQHHHDHLPCRGRCQSLVALLDLPIGTLVTLDGCEIRLQRDDFIGFVDFPVPQEENKNYFHFVAVRAALHKDRSGDRASSNTTHATSMNISFASIAVGFPVFVPAAAAAAPDAAVVDSSSYLIIHRYDPLTEEVSADPVDEVTQTNLLRQLQLRNDNGNGEKITTTIHPQRVLSYNQVVSSESKLETWKRATNCISSDLLQQRGILAGQKIVPGSYSDSDSSEFDNNNSNEEQKTQQATGGHQQDGVSVAFPRNIPVIDSSSVKNNRTTSSSSSSSSHAGTKKFISSLSPSERTAIFFSDCPGDVAFQMVFKDIYNGKWKDLVGDMQLAYTLFLQLSCFDSLEHWRDLVALLSFVSPGTMAQHVDLYTAFLSTMEVQIHTLENDFFENDEMSSGNFLKPSLQSLIQNLGRTGVARLVDAAISFQGHLRVKVPTLLLDHNDHQDNMILEVEDEDEEDEDGPAVVDLQEIEEFMARSECVANQGQQQQQITTNIQQQSHDSTLLLIRETQQYPILFAAVQSHEDVLMTCARALDEASDVSLVREAAAYLEEVEAKKKVTMMSTF